MSRESVLRAIVDELRDLRRQPGVLDTAKLTHARAILRGLGGDVPDVALTRLTDLAAEHADDRDIEAAMASIGWGATAEASLDRLSDFAVRSYVDPRTVRRWSDAGFKKLALLIIGTAPWIQPRARQILSEDGGQLYYGLDLRIPPKLRMGTPRLRVGSRQIEIGMPKITVADQEQRIASRLEPFTTLDELPVTVELSWNGEKFPVFEAVTHGTRAVHFSSRLVFRALRTTVSKHTGTDPDSERAATAPEEN